MRLTPALAIAYTQWCRHRRSLIAAVVILLLTAAVCPIVGYVTGAQFLGVVAAATTLPLSNVFGLGMNSLLFVDEAGNLSSGYAKAMYTLPVRSRTLVIWPMVYGSLTAALSWIATALLVFWPLGFRLPLVLPALAFAALMAWLQVVSWLPWANRSLRELLTMAILIPLAAIPIWLLTTVEGSRPLIGLLLVAYMAAAVAVGYAAVASSRRGEVWPLWPSVHGMAARGNRVKSVPALPPFGAASQAQFWYEWKCHGWVFPVYLSMVYTFILGLLVWRGAWRARLFLAGRFAC